MYTDEAIVEVRVSDRSGVRGLLDRLSSWGDRCSYLGSEGKRLALEIRLSARRKVDLEICGRVRICIEVTVFVVEILVAGRVLIIQFS